ncbi:MAG: DUF1573 domain-containing protein [Pirellula sp.]
MSNEPISLSDAPGLFSNFFRNLFLATAGMCVCACTAFVFRRLTRQHKSVTTTSNGRLLVSLMLICLAVCACHRSDKKLNNATGPLFEFMSEPAKNLGKLLPSSEPLLVTFQFRNSGNAPLTIESLSPSCKCARARAIPMSVEPGKSGNVELTLDRLKLGEQSAIVTIATNQSKSASKKVTVEWEIRDDIFVRPSTFATIELVAGNDAETSVDINSETSLQPETDLTATSSMDKEVQGLMHTAFISGEQCYLKILASADIKPGLYYGEVRLSKKNTESALSVPWYVQVAQPISIEPEFVSVVNPAEGKYVAQVVVNALSDIDLKQILVHLSRIDKSVQEIEFEKTMISENDCVLDFTFSSGQLENVNCLIIEIGGKKSFKLPVMRD